MNHEVDEAVAPLAVVAGRVDSPSRSVRQENLRAGAIMILAVLSFSLMDAGLKTLSAHYPPLQVTAIRGLSSLPIILVWIGFRGGYRQLLRVRFPLHLVRGILGIIMLSTFTWALRYLPLSEAYAIFFTAPLLITMLAVPLLGERVSASRWIAIMVGLAGAIILLRPTGTGVLTLAGLAVTVTAVGYALSAIIVRILGRTDTTESMVFWVMSMMGGGAAILALPNWRPILSSHWLVIGGIAIAGSLGQWAITEAFSRGQASFIAPLEYTALAWGVGLDWFLWHSLPGVMTFVGAAIIIASGIYLIRHDGEPLEAEHP